MIKLQDFIAHLLMIKIIELMLLKEFWILIRKSKIKIGQEELDIKNKKHVDYHLIKPNKNQFKEFKKEEEIRKTLNA